MTEDQYDAIGDRYEDAFVLPVFAILHRAFHALAGDVRGLDVLDVATGSGVYARQWAEGGARRVVGTDRSAEMIAFARSVERERPYGIQYHVADATEHPRLGPFDLVSAAFLLNYAYDENVMAAMTRSLYANLRPGGKLIGMLPNPDYAFDGPGASRFGVDFVAGAPLAIGTVVHVTVHADPPIGFEAVMARYDVFERSLARAGFAAPRWAPLHEADPQRAAPWTEEMAVNDPLVLFETSRPAA